MKHIAAQASPYPQPNQKKELKGSLITNFTGRIMTETKTRAAGKDFKINFNHLVVVLKMFLIL